jgi:hypothetical protein
VELGHDVRPGQVQEVGVALDVARMVPEPLAAEVLLGEPAPLQEHAPGAVEDDDPLLEQRGEVVDPVHDLTIVAVPGGDQRSSVPTAGFDARAIRARTVSEGRLRGWARVSRR